MQRRGIFLGVVLVLGFRAAPAAAGDFEPDPRSVQRYGPAYRYPQAGWIVLHIEGEPYQRGCQHGRLAGRGDRRARSLFRRRAESQGAGRRLESDAHARSIPCSCAAITRNISKK